MHGRRCLHNSAFQFMYFPVFDIDEISEIALLVAALRLQKSGKNGQSSLIEFIPVSFFIFSIIVGFHVNCTVYKSKSFAVN